MGSKSLIRSRWAAIGAAVAVTLGGGGLIGVSAASGDASSLKTVTPTRIMDTRQGTDGKVSGKTVALQVTGEITTYTSSGPTAATVVPAGANAVSMNLTVTGGERNGDFGFVTAFPCTAATDTVPNASTLNFVEDVDVANSTVVPLGATGMICLNVYGSAHLIVDANGYYETAAAGAVDAYTKAESDARYVTDAYTKAESDATETELQNSIDNKLDESEFMTQKVDYTPSTAGRLYSAGTGCTSEIGYIEAQVTLDDPQFNNGSDCEFHVILEPPSGDNWVGSSKQSEYNDSTGEVNELEYQWVVSNIRLCWQTNSALDNPVSKDMWLWAYGTNPINDYRTAATYLDLNRYNSSVLLGVPAYSLPFDPTGGTVTSQLADKNVNCGYLVPEGHPTSLAAAIAAGEDDPLLRYSKQLGAQQFIFGWELEEEAASAGDGVDARVDLYSVTASWQMVNVKDLSDAVNAS